jgi:hypothetical protein
MKIIYDIPDKFKQVLLGDTYRKNTKYSVTQILKEPRAVILENRHGHKVKPEVEDRLWAFFGTAWHDVMEKAEDDVSLIEERLKYGKVSGKFDHYDSRLKTIYDFKFTSVWNVVYGVSDDWQKQLSIYAWLLNECGFEVENIENTIIMRDWKHTEYERGKYKVPKPYATIRHDILTEIDGLSIKEYLDHRVALMDSYEETPDDELPLCSEEFRWADKDTFAVYKGQNKKAKRVVESEKEAEDYIKWLNDEKNTYRIEKREGNKYKRCEYCTIKDFCNQYKNML